MSASWRRWVARSTQEQAVAAWISQLNQLRLDQLVERLQAEGANLSHALAALDEFKQTALNFVVANRGGYKGLHGFIAEAAEVGIRNARSLVEGEPALYQLLNNNGPHDLLRGASPLQVKFSAADLSLTAIRQHLEKYPGYVANGGQYVVPRDFYEKIALLRDLTPEQATQLGPVSGVTMHEYRLVQDFYDSTGLREFGQPIEPAATTYDGVQVNTFERTAERESEALKERSQDRRDAAYQDSRPSLAQGAQATAFAAAGEGAMSFALGVHRKLKAGRAFRDFSRDDWSDVAGDAMVGTARGAIRGASIYSLTNFTATPAPVASGLVTATFGVVGQARLLRSGEIDQDDFLTNSQVVCLDAAVSAASSLLGQTLIPVPVLGAVVGNLVGSFVYGIAKNHLDADEQRFVDSWLLRCRLDDARLNAELRRHVDGLHATLDRFRSIEALAFDRNVNLSFHGSIQLARESGVPEDKLLKTPHAVDDYFLR